MLMRGLSVLAGLIPCYMHVCACMYVCVIVCMGEMLCMQMRWLSFWYLEFLTLYVHVFVHVYLYVCMLDSPVICADA